MAIQSDSIRIQKLATKYYPKSVLIWFNPRQSPLAIAHKSFKSSMVSYDKQIKDKQDIVNAVKKGIEPEITSLATKMDLNARMEAQRLTHSMSKELIVRLKEIQELINKKEIEVKAFEYALHQMGEVPKRIIFFSSLFCYLLFVAFAIKYLTA
jgi:hypothetical protein